MGWHYFWIKKTMICETAFKQVAILEMNLSLLAMITAFLTIPGISCLPTESDMSSGVEKRQSDEERLLEYLFTDYNPSARPVLNSSKTVNVTLMFSLMHIQELVSNFASYNYYLIWRIGRIRVVTIQDMVSEYRVLHSRNKLFRLCGLFTFTDIFVFST